MKSISIFGFTGSIGTQALQIIRNLDLMLKTLEKKLLT